MIRKIKRAWALTTASIGLLVGCASTQAPNENDNGEPQLLLRVANTRVAVSQESVVRASDHLVIGYDSDGDLSRLRAFDTRSGDEYEFAHESVSLENDFVVVGSRVLVRGGDGGLYTALADESEDGVVRIGSTVLAGDAAGTMSTDGMNVIAFVSAEPFVCWVDLREDALAVRTFGADPEVAFSHVAVDGNRIAFLDGTTIVVGDITAAVDGALTRFEVDADPAVPLAFSDDQVVYVSGGVVMLFDLLDDEPQSTGIESTGPLAAGGGQVCVFESSDSEDASPSWVRAGGNWRVAPDEASGSGLGWGRSCAVADGLGLVFIGGALGSEGTVSPLSFWQEEHLVNVFAGTVDSQGHVAAFQVYPGQGLVAFLVDGDVPTLGYIRVP